MSDETIPHIIQPLRAAAMLSPHDDPTSVQLALVSAAQEMIQVCLSTETLFRCIAIIIKIQQYHILVN